MLSSTTTYKYLFPHSHLWLVKGPIGFIWGTLWRLACVRGCVCVPLFLEDRDGFRCRFLRTPPVRSRDGYGQHYFSKWPPTRPPYSKWSPVKISNHRISKIFFLNSVFSTWRSISSTWFFKMAANMAAIFKMAASQKFKSPDFKNSFFKQCPLNLEINIINFIFQHGRYIQNGCQSKIEITGFQKFFF